MVEKKKKFNYIFGNILGNALSKVDMRTQFEASMMSMTLILIGLVVTIIYLFIYAEFVLWYKIFLMINCLAGLVFIWSFLVTTFQQFQNYMEIKSFQDETNANQRNK